MSDDVQHYRELIARTKQRLQALELQKAQLGFAAPPHIENEIAECHKDIELYNAHLWTGVQPSDKAKDAVPGDPDVVLLKYQVAQLRELVKEMPAMLERQRKETIDEAVNPLRQQMAYYNQEDVQWKAEERRQRKAGQEENAARLSKVEASVKALHEWQERVTVMFRSWTSRVFIVALLILVAAAAFYIGAHR